MVREAQIETATVDVEGVAQVAVRHRGALEVPAGTAPAERGRPRGGGRFTGLARLPQREVVRVALPGALAVVGRAEVLEPLMSELAVRREGPDVEIHVAVTDHICVAAVDELLHELDHVGDVAGRPRFIARADHSEGVASRNSRSWVIAQAH